MIDLLKKKKGRQKLSNVNVTAIYGCRQIGAGHENLKKLCCYLNTVCLSLCFQITTKTTDSNQ